VPPQGLADWLTRRSIPGPNSRIPQISNDVCAVRRERDRGNFISVSAEHGLSSLPVHITSRCHMTMVRTCDVQNRDEYDRCGGMRFLIRSCSPGSSLLARYDDFKSQILKRRPLEVMRMQGRAAPLTGRRKTLHWIVRPSRNHGKMREGIRLGNLG
jgi:hypothetical protein